ncbi:MAG: RNA polymerase sigma factor [Balneolaceae bacterium]|nr:RNA polymerase sigma factor [Balneolaceae bacterium]
MMNSGANATVIRDDRGFVVHPEYESYSDEEIVDMVVQGNTSLFEVILRRYNQKLFRIIRSYLNDEDQVKDVLQTTYLKAYENLKQFRGEARFSTWLIRIAINEALKQRNQQNHFDDSEWHTAEDHADRRQVTESDDPEDQAIREDMKKLLEEAVDALPSKYRSVFIMREVEQMNTRETAECLGITRVNVKVRLHRAKSKLRDLLEQRVREIDIFDFKGARCDAMVRSIMNRLDGLAA